MGSAFLRVGSSFLVCLGIWLPLPAGCGELPARQWTTTVQSGLADTFQLTLGGTFGKGPAWQSRVETGVANAWRRGDFLFVYGGDSLGLDAGRSDWQSGVGYRASVWRSGRRQLSGAVGFQHWKFASVKRGTNDWLTHQSVSYRDGVGPVGFVVTSDSWSLLDSPLPAGSLVHTQIWAEHPIRMGAPVKVTFRHGPAHTYSWGFYGTQGHRVIRYQTMVSIVFKGVRVEGGYRQQFGLQPSIPDNSYWQFAISRTWTRRLR